MGCCESSAVTKLPSPKLDGLISTRPRPVTVGLGKHQFVGHKRQSLRSDYKVVKLLGEGGFGQVFLVKDKRSGGLKAMKEISISQLDQEQREEVYREVQILKVLVRIS